MKEYGRASLAQIYIAAIVLSLVLGVCTVSVAGDAKLFVGYAIPQVAYVAVIVAFSAIAKKPLFEMVPVKKKLSPWALLLCIAVTIGLFLQNLLIAVSVQWGVAAMGWDIAVSVPSWDSAVNIVLSIIIICIGPAIGEEMMFRGVGTTALKSKGAVYAVLVSALLFSLSHGNLVQLVHQFILGVILAYITVKTGTIVYGAVIHFLNNLLALVLPLAIPAYNGLAACSVTNALIMLGMCLGGILILYPSLRLLIKKAAPQEGNSLIKFFKSKDGKIEPTSNAYGSGEAAQKAWLAAVIICMVLTVILNTLISAIPELTSALG